MEKQYPEKYILLIKNVNIINKYEYLNLFAAQHSETVHKQQQL